MVRNSCISVVVVVSFFIFEVFLCSHFLIAEDSSLLRTISFKQKILSFKNGFLLEQRIWMKNNKIRFEKKHKKLNVITIVKNGKMYNYFSKRHVGNVLSYEHRKPSPIQFDPLNFQSEKKIYNYLDSVNAKEIRKQTIEGHSCRVFRFENKEHFFITTVWINSDHFPLKSQCKLSDDIITIYYDDIKINGIIDDSLFAIPNHVHFQEILEPVW